MARPRLPCELASLRVQKCLKMGKVEDRHGEEFGPRLLYRETSNQGEEKHAERG